MSLILIGINYKSTDIETREKLAFSKNDADFFSRHLIDSGLAKGIVIVSTCLRVEVYFEGVSVSGVKNSILGLRKLDNSFSRHLYVKEDKEVVAHLFNLAAGLDSQVVGEDEIMHQIKDAYILALKSGFTTDILRKSFERALFVGKTVRLKTDISKIDPNIASKAVNKAKELSIGLKDKRIAVIGAGVIAAEVVKQCVKEGASCILVANRTFENAQKLARANNSKAVRFEEFYGLLNGIDILFSATKSKHLILKKEDFLFKKTSSNKLFIFDLAFPRDIDPLIADYTGVDIFDLDDFNPVWQAQEKQVSLAREVIKDKLNRFLERQGLHGDYFTGRHASQSFGY